MKLEPILFWGMVILVVAVLGFSVNEKRNQHHHEQAFQADCEIHGAVGIKTLDNKLICLSPK